VSRPAAVVLAAVALVGCGRERLDELDVDRPVVSGATVPQSYPKVGIEFSAPAGWGFGGGPSPLVTQSSSGSATIAVWRYERSEPLPQGEAALTAAREALLGAVRGRDQKYREISTRETEVDGAPAIELVGEQTIAGRPRRVRSTHVFAKGAEVVVDQYAAPADFARVDAAVFKPLARSLRLDPPEK
jgi:hypothetical protein